MPHGRMNQLVVLCLRPACESAESPRASSAHTGGRGFRATFLAALNDVSRPAYRRRLRRRYTRLRSGQQFRQSSFADLDVAERHVVPVVLHADVPSPRARVVREILELALADSPLPVRGPQLVLDELHAVQPVLDVRAA